MRICLINLVIDTNYGGNLQRFALCRFLTKIGHDVTYIPTYSKRYIPSGLKKYLIYLKRFFSKLIGKYHNPINLEKRIEREYAIQMPQIINFIKTYIPCYKKAFTESDGIYEDMKELNNENFDAFIVGSDQIWRSSPKRNIEHFFLDFIHNEKARKIAYAVSFGDNGEGYTHSQITNCGNLIKKFNGISFRENAGLDIAIRFNWTLPNKVPIVLDPTLLLTPNDYNLLLNNSTIKESKHIFCYILDINEQKRELITKISSIINKNVIIIDSLFPNINNDKEIIKLPSIETWLSLVKGADFVITDSFHGTMFSILFNRPFITVLNKNRGTERYQPILHKLKLDNRLLSEEQLSSISKDYITEPINWDYINQVLETERKISTEFLNSQLS